MFQNPYSWHTGHRQVAHTLLPNPNATSNPLKHCFGKMLANSQSQHSRWNDFLPQIASVLLDVLAMSVKASWERSLCHRCCVCVCSATAAAHVLAVPLLLRMPLSFYHSLSRNWLLWHLTVLKGQDFLPYLTLRGFTVGLQLTFLVCLPGPPDIAVTFIWWLDALVHFLAKCLKLDRLYRTEIYLAQF